LIAIFCIEKKKILKDFYPPLFSTRREAFFGLSGRWLKTAQMHWRFGAVLSSCWIRFKAALQLVLTMLLG